MIGTYLSVLKAERAEKLRAIEQIKSGRDRGSESLMARFRDQIAELDELVARVEARGL